MVFKILPKVGPLRPLAFEPLTEDAERLFVESVTTSRARYRAYLQALRARRLELPNTDFDTGRAPILGENRLADATHADLLNRLAKRQFTDVSPQLRQDLASFFAETETHHANFKRREATRIRTHLAELSQR